MELKPAPDLRPNQSQYFETVYSIVTYYYSCFRTSLVSRQLSTLRQCETPSGKWVATPRRSTPYARPISLSITRYKSTSLDRKLWCSQIVFFTSNYVFTSPDALQKNQDFEFERNEERFTFLKVSTHSVIYSSCVNMRSNDAITHKCDSKKIKYFVCHLNY